MSTVFPVFLFLCHHHIGFRRRKNLGDFGRFPLATFLHSHDLTFLQRWQFLGCPAMLHFLLSFPFRLLGVHFLRVKSWGFSVSSVTEMNVLRRPPMNISAGDKFNLLHLMEYFCMKEGVCMGHQLSPALLWGFGPFSLTFRLWVSRLDVTQSKRQSC